LIGWRGVVVVVVVVVVVLVVDGSRVVVVDVDSVRRLQRCNTLRGSRGWWMMKRILVMVGGQRIYACAQIAEAQNVGQSYVP